MAGSGDDKTEKATPKRRDDARKEGQVARSQEVGSALAMLGGFGVLLAWGPHMWERLAGDAAARFASLGEAAKADFGVTEATQLFRDLMVLVAVITGPVLAALLVVGVLGSVVQVKPKVVVEALKPKPKRLDPIAGAKQKLSLASLFELVKNLLKMFVIGGPAVFILWIDRESLLALGDVEPAVSAAFGAALMIKIGLWVGGIYIAIAILDWIFQKWRFEKQIRMTKSEVKQEHRQQELAPELKAQQRRRQREAARQRMLQEVPDADVVITNPTHYAVALKYDQGLGAPQVVAKGADLLALRIREIADEAGVPRMEDRPLARDLYSRVEVGEFIPADLYAAVAEVLAYVYRVDNRGSDLRMEREADRRGPVVA